MKTSQKGLDFVRDQSAIIPDGTDNAQIALIRGNR